MYKIKGFDVFISTTVNYMCMYVYVVSFSDRGIFFSDLLSLTAGGYIFLVITLSMYKLVIHFIMKMKDK